MPISNEYCVNKRIQISQHTCASADRGSCFVQVDTVLSRLTALKEHIEGTEALIEIDLDHRRNELVSFNLVRACS